MDQDTPSHKCFGTCWNAGAVFALEPLAQPPVVIKLTKALAP
jgi:hypothetical protein